MVDTSESTAPELKPCPYCRAVPRSCGHYFDVIHTTDCFFSELSGNIRSVITRSQIETWNTRTEDGLRAEIAEAIAVIDPSIPESGLVEICKQLKQAYISERDNAEKFEIASEDLRAENERQQKVFAAHTKAVGAFLSEMAEIHSLDALEPPPVTVAEVTFALLRVSRQIREQMQQDQGRVAELEEIIEASRSASAVLGLVQRTAIDAAERMRTVCVGKARAICASYHNQNVFVQDAVEHFVSELEAITLEEKTNGKSEG